MGKNGNLNLARLPIPPRGQPMNSTDLPRMERAARSRKEPQLPQYVISRDQHGKVKIKGKAANRVDSH